MEREKAVVEALVVLDHRIVFAGSAADAAKFPVRETVDLEGAAVLPGFIDTHCHMAEMAEGPLKVDLFQANCADDVIHLLIQKKKDAGPGEWIIGCNLEGGRMREKRLPNRCDLDKVSTGIPVFVSEIGLHSFMCNSKVLELAGISKGFSKKWSELLETDENGAPTGVLAEHGMLAYINPLRPVPYGSYEGAVDALYQSLFTCSKWGYTTLHTYDGFSLSVLDRISAYQDLRRRNKLPMRMIVHRTCGTDNELLAVSRLGDEHIKYGSVKFFADGTYIEHTAFLTEPYEDRPDTLGRLIHKPEVLKAMVKKAYDKGNDVAIHVIGDGAADLAIRIFEEIYNPANPGIFTLIHCHLLSPEMRERMAKLPVIAAMQPVFVNNLSTATIETRIGKERAKDFHAFGSALKAGVLVAGGTDGPISNQDPLFGISKAVNRFDCFGRVFQPQERLSVYDAVGLYTKNAAHCAGEDGIKGTLEAGKLADFIVLDKDIFEVEPSEIETVRVTATYLGGDRTF
jgi:predicted amidohydrolase YtcJ